MKIGSELEDGLEIGLLIDQEAREKVQDHVDDALSKGAQLDRVE